MPDAQGGSPRSGHPPGAPLRPLLALARLEWSVLGPSRLGALLLVAWSFVSAWQGTPPDELGPVDDIGSSLHMLALLAHLPFAFALGLARLAPELREGYADHLDALPVTRGARWVVKVSAGALLLVGVIVGSAGAMRLLVAIAPMYGADPLADLVPPQALAHAGAVFAAYGVGLALGWIGATAWVLVPLVGVLALFFSIAVPWTEAWTPLGVLWFTPELTDGRAAARLGPLVCTCLATLLAAGSSLLVFQGPAALLVAGGARAAGWLRGGATGCGGLVLGFVTFASFTCGTCGSPRYFQRLEPAHVAGFTVLAPHDDPDAAALLAALPAEAERARLRFSLPDALTLDIELTAGSRSHSGFTTPTKIRIATDAGVPTLRHELAHAATQARLGQSLEVCGDSLRFFFEGIAEDVELTDDAPYRANVWRHAAAVAREDASGFAALLDEETYVQERDELALYSLGFTFVDHLRATSGDARFLALLDAIGARCADTSGLPLWYGATREAGIDLTALVRGWRAALDAVALPERPVLSATIRLYDEGPVLSVASGVTICRFRARDAASEEHLSFVRASNGRCDVPASEVRWDSLGYQLGYELGDRPVYGPWRQVEVE